MSDSLGFAPQLPEELKPRQTADEMFPRQTADEMFPVQKPVEPMFYDMSGEYFDEHFGSGLAGYVLGKFGQGAAHAWGTRPFGELPERSAAAMAVPGTKTVQEELGSLQQGLRDVGMWNQYEKGEQNWLKGINETLMRGTAAGVVMAVDAAVRAPLAALYGAATVSAEAGLPIGSLIEAFPAGHLTGLPMRGAGPTVGTALIDRAVIGKTQMELRALLDSAQELGVIEGKAPENLAREAFAPDEQPRPTALSPSVVEPVEPFTEMRPTDVHSAARVLAPETFQKYDALVEQRQELSGLLEDLRVERDAPAQARIDDILGKVNNVEERLTKRAALRLELARRELEEIQSVDSPTMAAIRKERQDLDFQMRDLASDVSAAYREAWDLVPREEPVLEPVRAPTAAVNENVPRPDIDRTLRSMGWMDDAIQSMSEREKDLAIIAQEIPQIRELSQRRRTISQDVESQLVQAGRPAEEARAGAALVQALYETRAARFEGKLGRARDLYESDDPIIQRGEGSRRGSLNLARNVVTLMKGSDASTFLHETGHQWLETLRRDAQHPAAPEQLRADMETVRSWLGAEGDTLTRAQHEKFARGFERYLMEGQAPTSKLAKVFEQFKQWLTDIYQTVARLRAPITDDIRGVYDRLLSPPSKEPVIIPEREGAVDFASHAEQVARETPAADALDAADRILADRERVAEIISRAIDDARREARRGGTRISVPQREGVGREPAAGGTGVTAPDAAIDTGRSPPTDKSVPPDSASDTFTPSSDYLDKAGNIRIENLNVGDDVAVAIREAAAEKNGFMEVRRDVLSDEEVYNLSEDLGMSAASLDRRKIGEAFNAEEIVAARKLLVQSANEVRDSMARAAAGDEKGIIDYALARERHLLIQEQVAGITAEAGRALRAFRNLEGMKEAERLADFFQSRLKMTPAQLQHEAQMGLTLDDPIKINKFLRESNAARGPTWDEKVVELWINGLLSGPYTHAVNMVGNTTVAVNSVIETAGAAAVSAVLRHEHGVSFGEVSDRLGGFAQGSVEGVIAFGKATKDERVLEDPNRPIEGRRAIGGLTGQIVRFPGRMLASEDAAFKAIAYRQELNVLARRTAREEGLVGDAADTRVAQLLRDPTLEMEAGATRHARYQTFQNQLGPTGQSVIAFAESHPLARLVVPFIRTPTNIMKYAVERTPFGLASSRVRNNLLGRNGEVAQATQIARLTLGSMVMTAAAVMWSNDLLTDGGPSRPEEMATKRVDGWMPYSLKLFGTYFSYQRIDPIAIPIGIATDLAALAKAGIEGKELDKVATMAVTLFARDVFDKLPFRGISGLLQAITAPDQYGPRFLNQTLGSLVPAVIGQGGQLDDPFYREIRSSIDALKSRVPGLRATLNPKIDVWGNPIPETNIGPIRTSKFLNDPINQLMQRLEINKSPVEHKLVGVDLTAQQYSDYATRAGQLARQRIEQIVEMPEFGRMNDTLKKKVLGDTIDKARKAAATQVKMESLGSDNDIVAKGREKRLELLN